MLQKSISILEKAIKDEEHNNKINETIDVYSQMLGNEFTDAGLPNLEGLSNKEVAKFYLLVGYVALTDTIKILTPEKLKDAIGYEGLNQNLKDLFEEVTEESIDVEVVDKSSIKYESIYSKQTLKDFISGNKWQKHVEADIKAIYQKITPEGAGEAKGQWEKRIDDYFKTKGDYALFQYKTFIKDIIRGLKPIYETTYQLIQPFGCIVPTEDGKQGLWDIAKPSESGATKPYTTYSTRKSSMTVPRMMAAKAYKDLVVPENVEIDTKSETFSIYSLLNTKKEYVYFVKPHLRLLFKYSLNTFAPLSELKRNRSEEAEAFPDLKKQKYRIWEEAEADLERYLDKTYKVIIYYFLNLKYKELNGNFYDITKEDNMAEAIDNYPDEADELNIELLNVYNKMAKSILYTIVVNEYKGSLVSPAKIALHLPIQANVYKNQMGYNYIYDVAKASKVTMTKDNDEDVEKLKQNMTKLLIEPTILDFKIVGISHTFNKKVANVTPYFAASALGYIKNKPRKAGEPVVSWKDLLVGMDPEGNIIIGQNKVDYSNHVLHYMQAGSRSGKGVMSYNMILSALSENKLFFYNERKPDTVKILMEHAGFSGSLPNIAAVNGSDTNGFANDGSEAYLFQWQEDFYNKNKPNWFEFDETRKDDFIYLRQMFIVLSLINAIATNSIQNVNKAVGYDENHFTGLFSVFDEYSNFRDIFASALNPGMDGSITNKMIAPSIIELLTKYEPDDKEVKKYKQTIDRTNMYNVYTTAWVYAIKEAIIKMGALNNAGLANLKQQIDILIIGQGIKNHHADNEVPIELAGTGGDKFKKGTGGDAQIDVITQIFNKITIADYILGFPGGKKEADYINAGGKGPGPLNIEAKQYLNQEYRGWAYLRASDLTIAGRKNAYYFKPFLLLNEGTELPELKNPNVDSTLLTEVAGRYNNKPGGYLAFLANNIETTEGISWPEVRETIKQDLKLDENKESLAGVIPYAEEIGFDQSRYKDTIDFMNKLVQEKMGYQGTYHEFVTDVRPEWFIGIDDINIALFKGLEAFRNRPSLKYIRQYVNSTVYKGEEINNVLIGLNSEEEEDREELYDSIGDNLIESEAEVQTGLFDGVEDFYEDDEEDFYEEEEDEEDVSEGYEDSFEEYDIPSQLADDIIEYDEEEKESEALVNENIEEEVEVSTPLEDEILSQVIEPQVQSETLEEIEVFSTAEATEDVNTTPIKEVVNKSQITDDEEEELKREIAEAIDKVQKLGKADAEAQHLLFHSAEYFDTMEKYPNVNLESWYKESYKQTVRGMQDISLLLEKVKHKNLPMATETAVLLGLETPQEEEKGIFRTTKEAVQKLAEKYNFPVIAKPIDKNVYKTNLNRLMRANEQQEINDVTSNAYTKEAVKAYGLEDVYVLNGQPIKLKSLDYAVNAPFDIITIDGKEDMDATLIEYMRKVTSIIINKLGGRNQIKEMVILAEGKMVVNNFKLDLVLPREEYEKMPPYIKQVIQNQNWGQLFLWSECREFKHLTRLRFESYSFVVDYVQEMLLEQPLPRGTIFNEVSILEELPQVLVVQIGDTIVNREDLEEYEPEPIGFFSGIFNRSNREQNKRYMKQQMAASQEDLEDYRSEFEPDYQSYEEEEPFSPHKQRPGKAKAFAKAGTSKVFHSTGDAANKGTSASWNWTKSSFKKPGIRKMAGLLGLGATAVLGTSLVIYKTVDWSHKTWKNL